MSELHDTLFCINFGQILLVQLKNYKFNLIVYFLVSIRLSYKYSRLVDASHSKDGELPAAETCMYEEGEEEEDEVMSLSPTFLFICIRCFFTPKL